MFMILRRILIPLLILGGLGVAADTVTRTVAQDRLSQSIQDQFSMKKDPTVRISSFPFIYEALARNRVSGATITADAVTIDELALQDVRVELDGIRADDFLSTSGITVTVDRLDAHASVTRDSLQKFLTSRRIRVTIGLREGSATATARRVIAGRTRTVTATGAVQVARSRLRFVPASIRIDGAAVPSALLAAARAAVSFSVPVPELPGGVVPQRVELHAGSATLVAGATNAKVRLGGEPGGG